MTIATRIALGLAVSGALLAAPASAQRYPGYGYDGGYRGGYYPGRYYHHDNGGNIAAALIGGLVVGGLVGALASSANNNRATGYNQPRYAPQGYTQQRYQQGYAQPDYTPQNYPASGYAAPRPIAAAASGDSAAAQQVDLCARAAERAAQNNGGMARVVSIDGIDGSEASAQVRGTLEISQQQYGGSNRAGFTCSARYGEVTGIRLG